MYLLIICISYQDEARNLSVLFTSLAHGRGSVNTWQMNERVGESLYIVLNDPEMPTALILIM